MEDEDGTYPLCVTDTETGSILTVGTYITGISEMDRQRVAQIMIDRGPRALMFFFRKLVALGNKDVAELMQEFDVVYIEDGPGDAQDHI